MTAKTEQFTGGRSPGRPSLAAREASATPLDRLLQGTPYVSYAYAYPHKSAYRPLDPPVLLAEAWAEEDRRALFLYIHVPFCEMRCGFCNLFTTANPHVDLEDAYLAAVQRQAAQVRAALGPATFARLAIGGGTPTYLRPAALHSLFDVAERVFGADGRRIPVSVETSPHTAEAEKLRVLRVRGVDRISIGVQSFVEQEAHAAGRAQKTAEVEAALDRIRVAGFPTLNVDLIYGLPGQTVASWLTSLEAALRYEPEELYLYPLYVRPLTGLDRPGKAWDDERVACYREGRARLLAAGYTQVSMRMFQAQHVPRQMGPAYCCQEDGMVGLGCGARSYTRGLHYSSDYAVGAPSVRAILADYVAKDAEAFSVAEFGYTLDEEDQRRRYVIQSLLHGYGLDLLAYRARFGSAALDDLPELAELPAHGLAEYQSPVRSPKPEVRSRGDQADAGTSYGAACGSGEVTSLRLTERGMERSDTIGPWLYSARVQRLSAEYALR